MLKETILVCEALLHQPAGTMKVLFGFVFALTVFAQSAPTFEVASIKPGNGDTRGMGIAFQPGGGMTSHNTPLSFLIQFAFRVRRFQVAGGPPWINTDRWDIVARPETASSRDQIPEMMQALLAERFKVTLHRETKELPVYFLVPAKGGMKLPEWKERSCVTPGPNMPPPSPGQPRPVTCGSRMIGLNGLNASKIEMTALAETLSDILDRTVIDKTGWTGTFNVHLEFARDQATSGMLIPGGPPLPPDDSNAPSIFTAVQEQLGLKLDSGKAPVEILVVDHAEKPDEN